MLPKIQNSNAGKPELKVDPEQSIQKIGSMATVVPKVKAISKKAIEKIIQNTKQSLSSISDFPAFFDFMRKENSEYHAQMEDMQRESDKRKEARHKEVIDIIISATQKKRKADKKIKSEVKKDKVKEKKKETKPSAAPAKPEGAPAPAPRVEPPKTTAPATTTPTTPPPSAQPLPVTPKPPTATPNVPALLKPPVKAVATGGLLTAAALSVRGETGAKSIETVGVDAKKIGQVVPNDPKPGVSSYGIFGINSGGSVQKFVADNPQFELTGKPGTKEFDERWKKVAAEKTKEFYDAQLMWYDKYVYQPVKDDMQKLLPSGIGTDDKVVTYMADRRNQMGQTLEKQALAYAKDAKTPEEFVTKIAEHDISDENIRKAFPTYIQTHGEKNIPGLKNRVELRKNLALQVQSNVGEKISDGSMENAEMKKLMRQGSNQQVIIQQNFHNTTNRQHFVPSAKKQELNPTMQ